MTRILKLDEARGLVAAALQRNRTSERNSIAVATALVAAEADGHIGHGLSRVPSYAAQSRSGKVDGFAAPTVETPKPALLAIDAKHGFAYPALDIAIENLPALTATQGVAAAAIRRSHHCGAMGLVVERLANAGVAALMFANTPKAIAPWGGRRALFGTNPIAFATPLPARDPLVIDLSLSKVARGKVLAAKQKGEPIPQGWALDVDGRPTTDPNAALEGTMLPMGDAKGAALALMVEVLAAGLTGSAFGFEASSFLDAGDRPPNTGQLIVAFDPGAVGGQGYLDRIAVLVQALEADPSARLPGLRRLAAREAAMRNGLAISLDLLREIEALAQA